jgi:hypothetical protein
MQERLKVFTFISGHGETLLDSKDEDHINQWLASVSGEVVQITQSESEHAGATHHTTVCIWYVPKENQAPPAP